MSNYATILTEVRETKIYDDDDNARRAWEVAIVRRTRVSQESHVLPLKFATSGGAQRVADLIAEETIR